MKKIAVLLLMLCLLCAGALAEEFTLVPFAAEPVQFDEPVALYCGPTQGFHRHEEETIDLSAPYVCFGQYDCWVMVAQGVPEDFGPVGWIEGGLFDSADMPELSFEDGYAAMIEEDAPVSNAPLSEGAWDHLLPRGTHVTVLAAFGDFFYVQTEIDGVPARVFVAQSAL